jgi:hypothetical protein
MPRRQQIHIFKFQRVYNVSNDIMKEITDKIYQINQFIKEKQWFDFELIGIVNKALTIIGSTDFSYYHELKIVFHDVFYVQCPDKWKSDTSNDIIVIPELEEQKQINISYEIEQGYLLVKFIAEDIGPIYISCKRIDYIAEKVIY